MLSLALLCRAGVALADAAGPTADDIKAAGEEFDQGKKAYKQKAWADAAEHFEDADARAPSAVALEWSIKSRDKAGQLDRAAMLAALALQRSPDQNELAKLANDVLKRAGAELQKVSVKCSPACDLVIGTKLVHGRAATERTIFLQPGAATVHASWSGGRTRTAPVKAVKGGASELSFEAPPEEKAAPEPVPPPVTPAVQPTAQPVSKPGSSGPVDRGAESHGWSPAVFFVGAGLSVIAGGVTVWSGIDTKNHPGADAVRRDCAGQGESCPTYQDGLSRQRRTNILLGVTAGLTVTTGVIGAFFTDWSGGKKTATSRIEPYVGFGGGATFGARGRF